MKVLAMSTRFWAKVDKSGDCWLWLGYVNKYGYGHFKRAGAVVRAHRLSYELENGEIPEGSHIDHTCHVRHCVRPTHLRLASPKQNQENRQGPQRNNTSGVRGVYWHKQRGKWHASVSHLGFNVSAGLHDDLEDAKQAVIAKRNDLFTHNTADSS